MPKKVNSESETERIAREIVEKHLQIELEFSDFSGQVDYLSRPEVEPRMALEITSFTCEDKWELFKMDDEGRYLFETNYLQQNWLINVRGVPRFSRINRELLPRLVDLEIHQLAELRTSTQSWWLEKVPSLANLFKAIRRNNIESLTSRIGNYANQNEKDPRLAAIISSENWIYGGVNSSLELVEDFLVDNTKDRRKLHASNLPSRHIFVWIDRFSKRELREIFEKESIELPTRSAELPDEMTHLWLADSVTRRVLYFDPVQKWRLVRF